MPRTRTDSLGCVSKSSAPLTTKLLPVMATNALLVSPAPATSEYVATVTDVLPAKADKLPTNVPVGTRSATAPGVQVMTKGCGTKATVNRRPKAIWETGGRSAGGK